MSSLKGRGVGQGQKADHGPLPEPVEYESLGRSLLRFVGSSLGEALGNAYHAGLFVLRGFGGDFSRDENHYYSMVAPELKYLGKHFVHAGWRREYLGSMDILPPSSERVNVRDLYSRNVVQPLIRLGVISDLEKLRPHVRGFMQLYGRIPDVDLPSEGIISKQGSKENFMAYSVEPLVGSGLIRSANDWGRVCEAVDRVEGTANKMTFVGRVLPSLARAKVIGPLSDFKGVAADFDRFAKTLGLGEDADQRFWVKDFLKSGLVRSSSDWEAAAACLKDVPREYVDGSGKEKVTIVTALSIMKVKGWGWPEAVKRVNLIKEYAEVYGDVGMLWKTGIENFYHDIPAADAFPRRHSFLKDDSDGKVVSDTLIPLSGAATGVFFRKLSKEAFDAWVKASEAGVPCEEILRYPPGHGRAGEYRVGHAKGGMVRVACRFGGVNLVEFFRDPANEKFKPEIERQVGRFGGESGLDIVDPCGEIPRRLGELGVEYAPVMEGGRRRHMHAYNFVVEMADGRPKVRIIDFDCARIVG